MEFSSFANGKIPIRFHYPEFQNLSQRYFLGFLLSYYYKQNAKSANAKLESFSRYSFDR